MVANSRKVAKLGAAERVSSPAPKSQPRESTADFDRAFRNEVTDLVHAILRQSYVTDRASAQFEAHRWGLTLEQFVAASVSHHVMRKVEAEYA